MFPPELFRTTSFRLALGASLILTGSMAGVFALVSWRATAFEHDRVDRLIVLEAQSLAREPADTVIRDVDRHFSADLRALPIAGVFDRAGRPIAGDLVAVPRDLPADGHAHRVLAALDHGHALPARAAAAALPDGAELVIGRDMRELASLRAIVLQSLAVAFVPALLLSLAGGALIGVRTLRRIRAMHRAIDRIVAGGLHERLPASGALDDIDRLAGSVNRMLARLEHLLGEVRSIGDDIAHDIRTPLARVRTTLERARTLQTPRPAPNTPTPRPGSAERGNTEPGDRRTGSTGTGVAEFGSADPKPTGTGNARPGNGETGIAKAGNAEPETPRTGHAGPANAQPGNVKTGIAETGSAEPETTRTGDARPGNLETGNAENGTARTGSVETGTAKAGSAGPETPRTGNAERANAPPGSAATGTAENGTAPAGNPDPARPDPDDAITRAITELDRVFALVTALLRIREIETARRRSNFAPTRLAAIAADAVELYEPIAEAAGITLGFTVADDAVVHGDRDLLMEAAANLLDNAVKFTGPGGHVDVTVRRDADAACLIVDDDGIGLTDAERASVLTRFFRADRSRHVPGNGLGLNLVAAIASLHDGTVTVEGRTVGSRFGLRLAPLDPAVAVPAP